MGHIQQLAFALGPIEARTAAPQRPRPPSGRSPRPAAAAAQPLLLPEGSALSPATSVDAVEPGPVAPAPVAAPAPAQAPPVAAAAAEPRPAAPAVPDLLSDTGATPIKAALYLVIGFARQRERRRSGWRRVAEQGFASRRLAEEHAARLLARGRADGVVLTRQELGAELDAADEPAILARLGELPAELLEG
jgi:hypothetical protein